MVDITEERGRVGEFINYVPRKKKFLFEETKYVDRSIEKRNYGIELLKYGVEAKEFNK